MVKLWTYCNGLHLCILELAAGTLQFSAIDTLKRRLKGTVHTGQIYNNPWAVIPFMWLNGLRITRSSEFGKGWLRRVRCFCPHHHPSASVSDVFWCACGLIMIANGLIVSHDDYKKSISPPGSLIHALYFGMLSPFICSKFTGIITTKNPEFLLDLLQCMV